MYYGTEYPWNATYGRRTSLASPDTTSRRSSHIRSGSLRASNGSLRDKLLNETLFGSLALARPALDNRRRDYNTEKPNPGATSACVEYVIADERKWTYSAFRIERSKRDCSWTPLTLGVSLLAE